MDLTEGSISDKVTEIFFDKKMLVFPLALIVLALVVLGYNWATTGVPMERSIDLKGGTMITITTSESVDINEVENLFPGEEMEVRGLGGTSQGVLIQTELDPDTVINEVGTIANIEGTSVETVGPTLGEMFWQQTQIAILIAFVIMSIAIFILFREVGPSTAVIVAAIFDIVVTAALMDIIGIKLSLGTMAALLLLIGYSVDTDVLLTTEVIKAGKGTEKGSRDAIKTGLTMTSTTITALLIVLFVPTSPVINQIVTVLAMGLVVDFILTWILNVNILRWLL